MADTLATPRRRVKLYVLNELDKWEDRGTGHVRCEKDNDVFVLKVFSEDTGRLTLRSAIRPLNHAAYQLQEDTILTWVDEAMDNAEIALSFADPEACQDLWEKLLTIDDFFKAPPHAPASSSDPNHPAPIPPTTLSLPLSVAPINADPHDPLAVNVDASIAAMDPSALQRPHHPPGHVAIVDPSAADITHSSRFLADTLETSPPWSADPIDDVIFPDNPGALLASSPAPLIPTTAPGEPSVPLSTFNMPEPSRTGIEVLSKILADQSIIHLPPIRDRIISELSSGDYVAKLGRVFQECEKAHDFDGLAVLYHIVRSMFALRGNVLEVLVCEENCMNVVGCLEYDPERIAEVRRLYMEANASHQEARSPNSSAKDALPPPGTPACGISSTNEDQEMTDVGRRVEDGPEGQQASIPVPSTPVATSVPGTPLVHDAPLGDESKPSGGAVETTSAVGDKGEGEAKTCSEEENDPQDSTEKELSSHCSSDGILGPLPKNLGEETTSSGNVGRENAERRFVARVHRNFLESKVSFKSVVPITDASVVAKIHQNYRVAYIRDFVLSAVFDEGISSALSRVILWNNVDIIQYFISGGSALLDLFNQMKEAVRKRKELKEEIDEQLARSRERRAAKADEKPGQRHGMSSKPTGDLVPHSSAPPTSGESSPKTSSSERVLSTLGSSSGATCTTGMSNTTAPGPSSSRNDGPGVNPSKAQRSKSMNVDQGSSGRVDSVKKGLHSKLGVLRGKVEEVRINLRSMLGFLRELCNLAKSQEPPVRSRFNTLLKELGFMEVSISLIRDEDPKTRSLCGEVLFAVLSHDQSEARAYMLSSSGKVGVSVPRRVGVALRSTPVGAVPTPKNGIASKQSMPAADSTKPDANPAKASAQHLCDGARLPSPEKAGPSSSATAGDADSKAGQVAPNTTSAVNAGVKKVQEGGTGLFEQVVTSPEASRRIQAIAQEGKLLPEGRPVTCGPEVGNRKNPCPLLDAMICAIGEDRELGTALTIVDLLKTLLDVNNMRTEREPFLDVFYKEYICELIRPIRECAKASVDKGSTDAGGGWDFNASHVCDLLSYCVTHHAYRAKYFVLACDVANEVAALFKHKQPHVRLSALRFIRACIGLQDDGIDRYILGSKLLDPVMEMFKKNGSRDNLVSSAILEVVSAISQASRWSLLKCIVEEHREVLEPSEKYCLAFANAKRIYREVQGSKGEEDAKASKQPGDAKAKDRAGGSAERKEQGPGGECGWGAGTSEGRWKGCAVQGEEGMECEDKEEEKTESNVCRKGEGALGKRRRVGSEKGIRLSMSKGEVKESGAKAEDGEGGSEVWDGSEDSMDEGGAKRRRVGHASGGSGRGRMMDGSIETCTKAVMELKEGQGVHSGAKRKKEEPGAGEEDVAVDGRRSMCKSDNGGADGEKAQHDSSDGGGE
eukprot:GFKZ01008437.1.p1 GENE.GFKZ01008437.1~~GFKZ01008437.1.p1  ORF type:complete len:1416 (+),score=238.25 GFKZ01008437.1:562-4809(+)